MTTITNGTLKQVHPGARLRAEYGTSKRWNHALQFTEGKRRSGSR